MIVVVAVVGVFLVSELVVVVVNVVKVAYKCDVLMWMIISVIYSSSLPLSLI